MPKIKPKDIKSEQLVEYHVSKNDDNFFVGHVIKRRHGMILMKLLDPDGFSGAYLWSDYKMSKSYKFKADTKYLKNFQDTMDYVDKQGLKNTPELSDVEKMPFKRPFSEIFNYLYKNKIYFNGLKVVNFKKNTDSEYDGFITKITKKNIKFFMPDTQTKHDITTKKGRTRTFKKSRIQGVCFNDWEDRRNTYFLHEK